MAYKENDVTALERGYWPCRGFLNIRLAPVCRCCSPRAPVAHRGIHASRHWFQLPSGAVLVTILAEQVSDRHPNRVWPLVLVVGRAEGAANAGVLSPAGERGRKGVLVGDAGCAIGAYVPLVIWPEAIDAAMLLCRVELGGIFKVGGPARVGFDPATWATPQRDLDSVLYREGPRNSFRRS